jgi:hypothetical protein
MAGGRIPINQLDSLPIISAAQWVSGTQDPTQQYSGAYQLSYWSAAAVGIDGAAGVALGTSGAKWACISNALNLGGCSVFSFLQTKHIIGAGSETNTGGLLYAQMCAVGGTFPADGDEIYDMALGDLCVAVADFTAASYAYTGGAYPYTREILRGFSSLNPKAGSLPAGFDGSIVGATVRFLLVVPDPASGAEWSLEVWGQGP